MKLYQSKLLEKLKESLEAVLPIIGIVLLLSFTIAPIPAGILMAFLVGAILLVVGMMFFTLGAEIAMTPMGERIGTRISGSSRLPFIVLLCFTLGFIITVSVPASACRTSSVYSEQCSDLCSSGRRWDISCGCGSSYVIWNCALQIIVFVLSGDIYSCVFCAGRFAGGRI